MIDQQTIGKIIDSADIVDVISDFVSLKRRGGNYIACCPFHNEKTPSFSVSPSKGIYKCFGCGKAGNAVSFIMEHEHLSYVEAIKWLGRKYGIEVRDKEESEEEKADRLRYESLLKVSELAQKFYTDTLYNTEMGRAVGLSYFRNKRGFNDETIRKFSLGFALNARTSGANVQSFCDYALKAGYKKEFIIGTGLGIERADGTLVDKFYDRAMFPIHSIGGKVIAFGGRTLLEDKSVAKYVNSPETEIYHKSNSLYGIYQAKNAISRLEKCYLVEGYADVLSFHQAGIENVVASSGTSLTRDQIRLIKRFTSRVTVLYDGDEAGIKASLRGIDLLLQEGMEIKVALLPDGHDPDSFARSHSETEIREFLDKAETDFIEFKYRILSRGTENDPIQKARLIHEVIRTIALIPDQITRNVYIEESASRLDIRQDLMTQEITRTRTAVLEKEEKERRVQEREKERREHLMNSARTDTRPYIADAPEYNGLPLNSNDIPPVPPTDFPPAGIPEHEDLPPAEIPPADFPGNGMPGVYEPEEKPATHSGERGNGSVIDRNAALKTAPVTLVSEKELLYYLVRFGEYRLIFEDQLYLGSPAAADNCTVAQYIKSELETDDLEFLDPVLLKAYKEYFLIEASEMELLKSQGVSIPAVDPVKFQERIQHRLIHHHDPQICTLMPDLLYDEYNLNIKEFCKSIIPEENILGKIIPKAILIFKQKYTENTYRIAKKALEEAHRRGDQAQEEEIIRQIQVLMMVRNQFAKELKRLN